MAFMLRHRAAWQIEPGDLGAERLDNGVIFMVASLDFLLAIMIRCR
jgi:hypothetical protein